MIQDRITTVLWDTATFLFRADLFRTPIGQGQSSFGSGAKTAADTNLMLSGQLPSGWNFNASEIRCVPMGDTRHADLSHIVFRFYIGAKFYSELPADQAAARTVILGGQIPGLLIGNMELGFSIIPLAIRSGEPFFATVESPLDKRLCVRFSLHGTLYRQI